MSDNITLTGVVATEPRAITTQEGLAITSFRFASSQRRFDKVQQKWVDGETNWYTITAFRQLAANAAISVKKGERLVVSGRLRIREWESGTKAGTNIDVEADSLGHDLAWGTASFSRNTSSTATDSLRQVTQAPAPAEFPTESEVAAIEASSGELVSTQSTIAEIETPF